MTSSKEKRDALRKASKAMAAAELAIKRERTVMEWHSEQTK